MTTDSESDAVADDPVDLRFTTRPSSGDLMWNSAALLRRSASALVVGSFVSVSAAIAIVLGDTVGSFIFLLFGLSILTGVFVAPFVWWSIRQRRDLVLAPIDIEATRQGLSMKSPQASAHQDWSIYRRARETSRAFLLDTGTSAVVLLSKRGPTPAETGAFRQLLVGVGLLRPVSTLDRLRPLAWVAVGLAAAAILMLGPRFASGLGATATMDLRTMIEGRTVTLHGTTDLPDGAIVATQLIQTDEWDRDGADGTAPDPDTSPWIMNQEVSVRDRKFTATFNIGAWPPGRAAASAFFWIDASQPRAVIDRFGPTGSGLRGPDVIDLDDRGPTIQIQHTFNIEH